MDNSKDLARAERARLILNDPLVVEALAEIKATVMQAWEQSPARDVDGREYLHKYLAVIRQFEGALTRHIETGHIIKADIKAKEESKNLLAKAMERIRG
ncbi:MAG: hypothetical protein H6R01_440 [Burkholderiaceae bacterium]|nr:hypothetical protein [Burkholderiaceae bacterium]